MTALMDTFIENRWLVQPNHTNHYDMAHGGNVMKWMDELAAISAMRFAGQPCVTARMDQVNFHRPIPLGDAALIKAYVYDAGKTSVKVRVKAYREDPLTGDTELTTESYLVFVAIDEQMKPTTVPSLTIGCEEGEALRMQAKLGEAERLED